MSEEVVHGTAGEVEPVERLRAAAGSFEELVRPLTDLDWSVPAGDLEWSVRRVVDHLADVCAWYAAQLASRSASGLRCDLAVPGDASNEEALRVLRALADVLLAVVAAAPPDARAWHPFGVADAGGFAAMACDELLVHGWDVARGLGVAFGPDPALCAAVLARLFPSVPVDGPTWPALLWANGRVALPGRPRQQRWRWHAAPLSG